MYDDPSAMLQFTTGDATATKNVQEKVDSLSDGVNNAADVIDNNVSNRYKLK